jgi:hypothetical protein
MNESHADDNKETSDPNSVGKPQPDCSEGVIRYGRVLRTTKGL